MNQTIDTLRRLRLPAPGRVLVVLCAMAAALFLSACHLDMYDQPKFKPYRESDFYADKSSARPLVPGVVARNPVNAELNEVSTGKVNGTEAYVVANPLTVSPELLARGQERFTIFCATCHGAAGDGKGSVIYPRLNPRPANLANDPNIVGLQDGYYFDVVTNGKGTMFPYGGRISIEDRWAIIAHIRELQKNAPAPEGSAPESGK